MGDIGQRTARFSYSLLGPDSFRSPTPDQRGFVEYRDLGLSAATGGRAAGKVHRTMKGTVEQDRHTGWHYHDCDMQLVYVIKGEVEFDIVVDGSVVRKVFPAGTFYHFPGGTIHNALRTADGTETIQFNFPDTFATIECEPPARP